jgi:flagellar hook-basal body complex protein FliE
MAINPLNNPINTLGTQVGGASATQSSGVAGAAGGSGDFSKVLMDSIGEVNRLQSEASDATQKFATGQSTNVAEVMVAVQKADIAYSTLMEIKNKLMDAYNEIQQMRV